MVGSEIGVCMVGWVGEALSVGRLGNRIAKSIVR